MRVHEARRAAGEWVNQSGSRFSGFCGAYLAGSFLQAKAEDIWPDTSDIDIVLVLEAALPAAKPGKFRYHGALLEVTLMNKAEYASLAHVLATHYLAYALHTNGILADPQGWLGPLHLLVKAQYGAECWVRKRCQFFLTRIRDGIAAFPAGAPFHEQVTAWLFPTGITTFPLLNAALENCTVRKRYTAARAVLETYGMMDFYPALLRLLTGDRPDARSLPGHLLELETTFDLAAQASGPSAGYPFRSDISQDSRPIAIDGCRQQMLSPYPMEAAFWMAATFARCHTILAMDAPDAHLERLPAFRAFMESLGIAGPEAFAKRNRELLAFLPEVEQAAEEILQKRRC